MIGRLRFRLSKHFGAKNVLDDFALEVRGGEFVTFLGPSGCGKSTALNLLAGLLVPTAGEIWLDEQRLDGLPPERRGFGMVFQNYALFPHLSVGDNIAFPLRMRRVPEAAIRAEVRRVLEIVRLPDVADRLPRALSGGQQQRIALARALVNRPKVLLLDEPLGALDLKLRQAMQIELKRIQREVGITFVYVTHDQEEALTMSDRLAVMNEGRVEQAGTPVEVYERPASDFVAGFIGVSNLLERDGRHVTVRPEKIRILDDGEQPEPGAHVEEGTIGDVVYVGSVTRYFVDLARGDRLVVVRQNLEPAAHHAAARGRTVRLAWRPEQSVEIETGNERHTTTEGVEG